MSAPPVTLELEPFDNERLANLCGQFDEHLRQIERQLGIDITARGNLFSIDGERDDARRGRRVLEQLYDLSSHEVLTPALVNLQLQQAGLDDEDDDAEITVRTRRGLIRGRGPNQKRYLDHIHGNDINFGVG